MCLIILPHLSTMRVIHLATRISKMILYYGINFSGPSNSESLPIHHGNKDLEIQIRAQATVMLQRSRNPLLQYRQEQACLSLELAIITGLRRQCFGYDKMVSVRQPQTMSASLSRVLDSFSSYSLQTQCVTLLSR